MVSNLLTNIDQLVSSAYEKALNNDDVIFKEGKTVEDRIDGCSYQIRYIPSLEQKPEKDNAEKDNKDPLAPPYDKGIHVCDIPNYGLNEATYAILLNRFPSTKNHFLLTQHKFAKQSDLLTADDLSLTYQIIRNYKTSKLVAFYNCGEESGASQKHKHIQFFPVLENEPPIDVYLQGQHNHDEASQLIQVPWTHFVISIHPPEQIDELADYLMNKFIKLLDEIFRFKEGKEFNSDQVSYNVLITKHYFHIIPRSREIFILNNGSKKSIGGINYAGILNVKQEEDIDEIKKIGTTNILLAVGQKKDEENKECD